MEETIINKDASGSVAETAAQERPACALFAALARAQSHFQKVRKNRANEFFKSRYADLEAVLDAARPALNAEGLYLYQDLKTKNDEITCRTVICHSSGETLSGGEITMKKQGGNNAAQAMGSAITYARRYSASAMLGISSDDDDDGNACAENPPPRRTSSPAAAPAPAPVECPPELEAKARTAALLGLEAYQSLFQALSPRERNLLAKSGKHGEMKALAATIRTEAAE